MSCGLFKRGSTSVVKTPMVAQLSSNQPRSRSTCATIAGLPRRPQLLLGQMGDVEVWRVGTFNAVLALLSTGCRGRFFMEETETCPPSL